jgi:GrpB-like predicted nucleotidyltransferase (UPF0157 family)
MPEISSADLAPYNPNWPAMFEAEAARLRIALGPLALHIDHHGSTAVPGLSAKPVIDIQISVAVLQPLDPYRRPLETLGYVHVPHPDDAFCPFFHRPSDWPHTHHVHVVQAGGDEERRTLAFRDYLRRHDAAAHEYAQLKRQLMDELDPRDDAGREAYATRKSAFVERIIALAQADRSETERDRPSRQGRPHPP